MLWTCLELSINYFQAFLMMYFIRNRLNCTDKHALADFICVFTIGSFFSLYFFFDVTIPDTVVFIVPMLYGITISKRNWILSTYWTFVLAVLFLSTVSLSIHLFMSLPGIPYDVLMSSSTGRLAFLFATNFCLWGIVVLSSRLKCDQELLKWPVLLLFLVMLGSIFVAEEVIYGLQLELEIEANGQSYPVPFAFAYLSLLACVVSTILFFSLFSANAAKELQYKTEIRFMEMSKQHQHEITQIYKDLQMRQHDLKHHIQVLETLVQSSNMEQATEYMNGYHSHENIAATHLSGCIPLDALIAAKTLTMKEHNISFDYTPHSTNHLPIPAVEFCTVVGNLLDNAIEALLRIQTTNADLCIKLSFARVKEMFYIQCSNPCNPASLKKHNNTWLSSKKSDSGTAVHSLGISSIKRIVEKNSGRCSFDTNDEMFFVRIALPYPFDNR